MTDKQQSLDLSELAVDRSQPPRTRTRSSRAWAIRYALPAAMLASFVGLFIWAARDSFLPSQEITICPVVTSRSEIKQAGMPLFQAAGWVEPRPSPVVASALAPGVVESMLVIEGQVVQKDMPLATLIEIDAKLALADARAKRDLQLAEVRRAEAAVLAAKTNLAKPLKLQAELADAEIQLSITTQAIVNLPFAIEAVKTRQTLAAENVRRKEQAGEAVVGRLLREARAELSATINAVHELMAREPSLQRQQQSLQKKRDTLAERLELLTDEKQALAQAEASRAIATAQADQSKYALEAAQLNLDRMTVRAPITGRILSIEARPGQRLSGINPHSEQGSSAVVRLYDPASLQVRVDVRLEDVPQVLLGQPVRIESAAVSDPISGEVISVTTLADIQKNTLQVKVAIIDPPEVLRPEMLSKVTFLAPETPEKLANQGASPLRLFVARELISTNDGVETVWVADLTARVAKRKTVTVRPGLANTGLVEVSAGLLPTDKLIVAGRDSLKEGMRVRVVGEDRSSAGGNQRSFPGRATVPFPPSALPSK